MFIKFCLLTPHKINIIDDSPSSYSLDSKVDDWPAWKPNHTTEKLGHRPTRSLSSIPNITIPSSSFEQTSFSADTSPKLTHLELCPSKSSDEKQKIFGAFSLFEGSPSYKQRQRRRALSFNFMDEDYQGSRLELVAINAGLAIINPHNLFQQSNHNHYHDNSGPEKVYTCPLPQCSRLFKRLEHLKRHFRTHTMERPYSCNMCGKHFSRTDNLAQHKKTHNRARSSSVISRCNSSSKLAAVSSPEVDHSTTRRKRASSLRNNCSEIIDKLSVLSSNDVPLITTPVAPNIDYFSYPGGDMSGCASTTSPSGSAPLSDEDLMYNNNSFEDIMPYQIVDKDVYMTDENEMNNAEAAIMYDEEDDRLPYDAYRTSHPTTSSSFMWQQSGVMGPSCSTASSSSSLLFNSQQQQQQQQYYHRLSWYSSIDDKSVSPTSSPSSMYDNSQTYSWHQI